MTESSRLFLVHRPGLRSIQQRWQDDRLAHLQFTVGVETVAIPDCALQTAEGLAGFGDPAGHFTIDLDVTGEGAAEHSSPDIMVCVDAGVEGTKDSPLISLRHRRQVLVEFAPCGVRAGHRQSVDADAGGEFASPERQTEALQTTVDALRQTGQSSHDVVPDGKVDAPVPWLCFGATAPEEGVAGICVRCLQPGSRILSI
ncbi:hypothetical protein SprV_0200805000 [Sparganum proliferum]